MRISTRELRLHRTYPNNRSRHTNMMRMTRMRIQCVRNPSRAPARPRREKGRGRSPRRHAPLPHVDPARGAVGWTLWRAAPGKSVGRGRRPRRPAPLVGADVLGDPPDARGDRHPGRTWGRAGARDARPYQRRSPRGWGRSDATRRGRRGYIARRARPRGRDALVASAVRSVATSATLSEGGRFRTPRAEGGAGTLRTEPTGRVGTDTRPIGVRTLCTRLGYGRNKLRPYR